MLAPVTLEFYGTCYKMARIFSSSYLMMKVGAAGRFQCSNSAQDALRNWNLSRWYFHLSSWHFPVAARWLWHNSCWTGEKNHSNLKVLLNHSKEPCLDTFKFTERISKHITSVTDGESDEICSLFDGQSPPVEEGGEAVFLFSCSLKLLHPSLAASRLVFICDPVVS